MTNTFKEMGEKLKADQVAKESVEVAKQQAGQNELEAIRNNPELNSLYKDAATIGAENLAGQLPMLKVHTSGKSQNELADGEEPTNGSFFYVPTRSEYKELDVHILTVSKGFYAPGMADKGKDPEPKFNQLVGGAIIDTDGFKPFMMYFTGSKLSRLWEFAKEAKQFTSNGIPMFALTVKLKTEKVTNDYGYSWVIDFDIVKAEDGTPTLIHDVDTFKYLQNNVPMLQEMINSIITTKENKNYQDAVSVINSADYENSDPETEKDPDDMEF